MNSKLLMSEAASMYYEKKMTQQEIANIMNLSRQTVSKLINDAVKEQIVEIKVHNPEYEQLHLRAKLCELFNVSYVSVCAASADNTELRKIMTAKATVEYILPLLKAGNKRIGISWGKTIQAFINEMPEIDTKGNVVFPLFGATERQQSYFLSNELARVFADKINGEIHYAWFPYKPENKNDYDLFKRTSYYKNMENNWRNIDCAIVGIGNRNALYLLGKAFGSEKSNVDVGDIATHTFNIDGRIATPDDDTLCVSVDFLKNAKQVIGVACGDDKAESIVGALRTGIITALITDEYTAKRIIEIVK